MRTDMRELASVSELVLLVCLLADARHLFHLRRVANLMNQITIDARFIVTYNGVGNPLLNVVQLRPPSVVL